MTLAVGVAIGIVIGHFAPGLYTAATVFLGARFPGLTKYLSAA